LTLAGRPTILVKMPGRPLAARLAAALAVAIVKVTGPRTTRVVYRHAVY
jgi:hypothetical protein